MSQRAGLISNKNTGLISNQWMTSPFYHLDVYGSPGNSMSSFCLSSPGRFSPPRSTYGITPGSNAHLQFRMSPETPLLVPKGVVEDLVNSPLFSPGLFSPFDSVSSRNPKLGNKLSLEQDFLDVKIGEAHDRLFASLQGNGIM